MKTHTFGKLSIAVIAATCLLSSQAIYASSSVVSAPMHAMFAKSKTVKLSLRNDSPATIELRAGESVMKIDAGKTLDVNLPAGTRITANAATPHHEAGALILEVQSALSGATVSIT